MRLGRPSDGVDVVGEFQFTHPGRGATEDGYPPTHYLKFQFTHPGRGATRRRALSSSPSSPFQFTHPGRGATRRRRRSSPRSWRFNSRTPGGVRPPQARGYALHASRFNSRTPGGVRLDDVCRRSEQPVVSIHAPREGCDQKRSTSSISHPKFQFTHPGRGATEKRESNHLAFSVSIHAPREGCDLQAPTPRGVRRSFNSRTPGGVRQVALVN